jgi:hypothetical protein
VRAALLALLLGAATVRAADVARMQFDQIVARAGAIVHGTVRTVASGRDAEGLPATWVTLDVREGLKGALGDTLVFKQVGVSEPLPDGTLLRIAGLPRFAVGEEVVLFLYAPSRHGFTSPVGLAQGVFRVERGGTLPIVRPGPDRAPTMRLDGFLDAVRGRVTQ